MGKSMLIYVPYDSGKAAERYGRGPLVAREAGLAVRLSLHHDVTETIVVHSGNFATEGSSAFELARRISAVVSESNSASAFPIVIAGNCTSSLGTFSGMSGDRRGVVWLDSHLDYDTADTSTSGYLDGMPTAMLTGETYKAAVAAVPGFRPVNKYDIVFIGARDIDRSEAERLKLNPIPVVAIDNWRKHPESALEPIAALGRAVSAAYLHFDMDVLEPSPVRVNDYHTVTGGPRHGEVETLLHHISERTSIRAAGITAWDPSLDRDGIICDMHARIAKCLADLGTES